MYYIVLWPYGIVILFWTWKEHHNSGHCMPRAHYILGKKSRCKRDLVESMLFSISNSSVALMAVVQLGVEKSTL